jgi:hypothetical protein
MNVIAVSTRAAAAIGSSLVETDSPADDMAPKKIRVNVSVISSSSCHVPASSTEPTMSRTFANVDRSSCSRNRA